MENKILQQAQISQQLMDTFNAANIKKNIKWLSEKMHVAGTKENAELMTKIADKVNNYSNIYRNFKILRIIQIYCSI